VSEDSYPFITYSGLLEPEHYQRIGSAIWLFLWCISSTTKEVEKDGTVWGIVKGNKPHKLSDLAEIFKVNEKTVRRWLECLEEYQYLRITRAPYGLILTVKNSKKYRNRLDKNVQSQDKGERTNMSTHPAEMSNHSDKNVQSNKDITEDITKDINNNVVDNNAREGESGGVPLTGLNGDDLSSGKTEVPHTPERDVVDDIAAYYMGFKGKPDFPAKVKDYKAIKKLLSKNVPIETIYAGIRQSFEEFKPEYPGDEITSFVYCQKVVETIHHRDKARKESGNGHYKQNNRKDSPRQFDYDELSL
jgi:hypothetical protein